MGLREKVALFIMVVLLVQLMYGECGPRTKRVKNSRDVSHKPRRSKLRRQGKTIQKLDKKGDDVVRRFNFPEVEYSLPMSQPSTTFSKHNFDLQNGQESHSLQSVSKSDTHLTSKSKNRKLKANRKNNRAEARSTKIPQIPYSEIETLPNTKYTNYKEFFPSVDYPLDASDLWTPYYWNRIPPTEPDLKFNVKDMSINTKATEEISKLPKGPKKGAAITKIVNSIINTETTYKSKKELVNNDNNDTCSTVVTDDNKKRMDDLNNPVCLTDTDKLSCDEVSNNSVFMTLTTPISFLTPTYDSEPSTVSHIISPLTTSSPVPTFANENVCYGKDTVSTSSAAENEENDEMPDDMGYTLMYPEVINYVSTSTTAPLLVDNIDMWMYPELDNHTLNTYSDEVDQCYILVP